MSPDPVTARPAGAAADESRPLVPWGVGLALATFVLAFVGSVVVQVLLATVLGGLGAVVALDVGDSDLQLLAAAALPVTLACAVLAVARARSRRGPRLVVGRSRSAAVDVAIGVGIGLGAFLIVVIGLGLLLQIIFQAAGAEVPTVQPQFREWASDPTTILQFAAIAVLLAPVGEELFFRGMLFPALRRRLPPWPSALVSGAAFATVHAIQPTLAGGLLAALVILPVGVALAWLVELRGSLLPAILCHATYNAIQVALLYYVPELAGL